MRSIYALIPAALLVGTMLSAPAEAKKAEDPGVHAARLISKKEYFKVMSAKKRGQAAHVARTRKIKNAPRETASERPRKISVDPRKVVSFETELPASPEKRKTATVEKPRKSAHARRKVAIAEAQVEAPAKARKRVKFSTMSLSKVMRSGPRPKIEVAADAVKPETTKSEQGLAIATTVTPGDEHVMAVIRELAPSYGVPTWFALRIANVESGYNPYARGRAGEIGIYQLKCQTARGMGFEGECSQLTDVRTNVRWGLKHLSLAIASSGGNLKLAASKHNAGLGRKSLVNSYIAKVF